MKLWLPEPAHAEWLAPRLRPADALECACVGLDPLDALLGPFRRAEASYAVTLALDGEPVAMAGAMPIGIGHGAVWLLGSARVADDPRGLLRASRHLLERAFTVFHTLENLCLASRPETIRYLLRLGFDFDPAIMHLRGEAFLHFRLGRSRRPTWRHRPHGSDPGNTRSAPS